MSQLLFATTADVAAVVPISTDFSFPKLKPYLITAQAFVERYTGEALLQLADNATQHPDLAESARLPIANLAVGRYIQANIASITDGGLLRNVTEHQKDAFEWQYEQVRANLIAQAWDSLEDLLTFAETNYSAQYALAPYHQRNSDYLIQSAQVFDEYYPIGSSRLRFVTLQPALREVEERRIRPVLGSQHTALLGPGLTTAQTTLLNTARRTLAYGTIALAIRQQLVSVTEQGVQVMGLSQFSTIRYAEPASDERLQRTLDFLDQQTADLLNQLSRLANPNPPTPSGSRVIGGAITAF
jgi:hypothetical protein